MATYVVGDIHGCFETFQRLLDRIEFDPNRDRLWLVGDLVNGGPASVEVLRWVHRHRDRVETVLGNHDLHLLAVEAGAREPRDEDDFEEILAAPDAGELLDWLRHQPLVHREGETLMVHAGLLPEWSADDAVALAGEVEEVLVSDRAEVFLEEMYGNRPRGWRSALDGIERLRVVVNACTRMRALDGRGDLDFEFTETLAELPSTLRPWFEFDAAAWRGTRMFFGHWSAIGYHQTDDVHALDSGCAWGGQLSALRLEDESLFQVDSELPAVFD